MMNDKRVECNVIIPRDMITGTFANAFRVVRDNNREWFLDFLVYSATENKASLVVRIRVLGEFLPTIRDRLSDTLLEAPDETVLIGPGEIQ